MQHHSGLGHGDEVGGVVLGGVRRNLVAAVPRVGLDEVEWRSGEPAVGDAGRAGRVEAVAAGLVAAEPFSSTTACDARVRRRRVPR